MLPLEAIYVIPSLFVTPLAAAVLIAARKWPSYVRVWRIAVVVCVLLVALFTILTLATPLYSEREHSSSDPGSIGNPLVVLMLLAFVTCVVIPAFPVLVALGLLPPPGRSRRRWAGPALLIVGVCGALIVQKNVAFWADYSEEKAKPRQSPFERFEHLRSE